MIDRKKYSQKPSCLLEKTRLSWFGCQHLTQHLPNVSDFLQGFLHLSRENPRGRGFLAHRSVLDGLLCRARARLKMGDAIGARADATTACGMAGLVMPGDQMLKGLTSHYSISS